MAQLERMYTLKEIGELSGLSRATLFRHIKNGKLKAVIIGNAWKVTETNLRIYLGQTETNQGEDYPK